MELVQNRTGTEGDCDTMGLVQDWTATQWD